VKINKTTIMLKTGMAIMLLTLVFCAKAQTFKSGLNSTVEASIKDSDKENSQMRAGLVANIKF